jgi:hypothetical protein
MRMVAPPRPIPTRMDVMIGVLRMVWDIVLFWRAVSWKNFKQSGTQTHTARSVYRSGGGGGVQWSFGWTSCAMPKRTRTGRRQRCNSTTSWDWTSGMSRNTP